jgi:hypothetical protein
MIVIPECFDVARKKQRIGLDAGDGGMKKLLARA